MTQKSITQAGGRTVSASESTIPVQVAILTNFIPPYMLPVLQRLSSQVQALRLFLSIETEPDRRWKIDWGGLKVIVQKTWTVVRRPRHPLGHSVARSLHFPYDTIPLLRNYKPQVVISAQLGLRTIQAFIYCKTLSSAKLILWADLSEHTECGAGVFLSWIRRILIRSADAVLVNGSSGGRYVERLGASRAAIFQVPFVRELRSSPTSRLTRSAIASHRLLYVGQLDEHKGVHLLLAALNRWKLRHPDRPYECLIVGEGALEHELKQFVESNELNVRFLGHVPFDELFSVYESAGIFVLPTLEDTWGVVVNEALAAGLPVLGSTYSQAVEELVEDDVTGWRFRSNQSEEIDAALDRALATDPASLNRMRLHAQARVAELTPEFAASRIADAIAAVCKS